MRKVSVFQASLFYSWKIGGISYSNKLLWILFYEFYFTFMNVGLWTKKFSCHKFSENHTSNHGSHAAIFATFKLLPILLKWKLKKLLLGNEGFQYLFLWLSYQRNPTMEWHCSMDHSNLCLLYLTIAHRPMAPRVASTEVLGPHAASSGFKECKNSLVIQQYCVLVMSLSNYRYKL